jgi:hypothetical protein
LRWKIDASVADDRVRSFGMQNGHYQNDGLVEPSTVVVVVVPGCTCSDYVMKGEEGDRKRREEKEGKQEKKKVD